MIQGRLILHYPTCISLPGDEGTKASRQPPNRKPNLMFILQPHPPAYCAPDSPVKFKIYFQFPMSGDVTFVRSWNLPDPLLLGKSEEGSIPFIHEIDLIKKVCIGLLKMPVTTLSGQFLI